MNVSAHVHRPEDALHSVAATVMGFAFAFAFGVVTAAVTGRRSTSARRSLLDVVAVAASVVVPLAMAAWPGVDGALQRVMFAVAYLWYGSEAPAPRVPSS